MIAVWFVLAMFWTVMAVRHPDELAYWAAAVLTALAFLLMVLAKVHKKVNR